MTTYKDFLIKENITDLSVLDKHTRQAIKDYENIAKSTLPTVRNKETGEYSVNAQNKLDMLEHTIKNGITEYLITRDEADEHAQIEQKQAEEKRLADEQAAKEETERQAQLQAQENARLAREDADKQELERNKAQREKKGLFGVLGM
jgi:hypothetical protein